MKKKGLYSASGISAGAKAAIAVAVAAIVVGGGVVAFVKLKPQQESSTETEISIEQTETEQAVEETEISTTEGTTEEVTEHVMTEEEQFVADCYEMYEKFLQGEIQSTVPDDVVICGPPEDVEGVVVLQSGEKPFLDDLKSNMNVDDVAVSSEYIDAGSDDIPELRISLTSDTNGNSMDAVLKYQYDELKITSCFYNESYSDINIYAEDEVNLNGLNEFGILDSEGKYHTVYKYCHLYEDSNGIDYNQDIITVDENIEQIFGNEYGFKGWFTMVYQIGDQIYYVMDSWMYQTEEIREKYYELCNSTSIDQSMIIQEQELNSIIAEEKKKY